MIHKTFQSVQHLTFHDRFAHWLLVAQAVVFTLAVVALVCVNRAYAQPFDPHIPMPPLWCPGNAPGISSSGYGAYCEGVSYPDGTRWNTYRLGGFWQPMRCIFPDGSVMPVLAPNGCGTVLR